MAAERRFRAMGTDVHLVVHGPEEFADDARARIDALEQLWSRFLPHSEISRLNEQAGRWVSVSADTFLLVRRAVEGHALTGGLFDPTVLGDLERAGYDRSFELLTAVEVTADQPGSAPVERHTGASRIELDAEGLRVRLPEHVGFDPGGIGKGLAADLVAQMVSDAGAAGALVNIGGDLRAIGFGPEGDDWHIQLDPAASGTPVAGILLHEGAIATSTTLRRRWSHDGRTQHHLIDPVTGAPAAAGTESVSVIAARAWQAEILAKAALIAGAELGLQLIETVGADALVLGADGSRRATPGLTRFLAPTPEVVLT